MIEIGSAAKTPCGIVHAPRRPYNRSKHAGRNEPRPVTRSLLYPEATFMAVDLAFLTIAEASALLKARQLSPVEYVEALIRRT